MKNKLYIQVLLLLGLGTNCNAKNNATSSSGKSSVVSDAEKQFVDWAGHQFSNRMLWMTHKRRFVLPKGTILQLTPKITFPVFRHAPYNGGFDSDIQASWTFYSKYKTKIVDSRFIL